MPRLGAAFGGAWVRSAVAVAVVLCALSPTQALPQQCDDRDAVLELLAEKYREAPVAFGVTNSGGLVELLTSAPDSEGDTWTIVITTPMGLSCLVAAGEGWRALERANPDPES